MQLYASEMTQNSVIPSQIKITFPLLFQLTQTYSKHLSSASKHSQIRKQTHETINLCKSRYNCRETVHSGPLANKRAVEQLTSIMYRLHLACNAAVNMRYSVLQYTLYKRFSP